MVGPNCALTATRCGRDGGGLAGGVCNVPSQTNRPSGCGSSAAGNEWSRAEIHKLYLE